MKKNEKLKNNNLKKNLYNKKNNRTNNYHHHSHHYQNSNSDSNEVDDELFINYDDFKFLFIIKKKVVLDKFMNFSLSFLVKAVALIYSFRSLAVLNDSLKYSEHIDFNCLFNFLCIFTSILLYISIFLKSYFISFISYYIYFLHFLIKFIMSIKLLNENTKKHKYPPNALIGIILGLSVGTTLNIISTYIVFSHMVYNYNYKYYLYKNK